MKTIRCMVDDRTAAVLERLSHERGVAVELLASAAIENEAIAAMTDEERARAPESAR